MFTPKQAAGRVGVSVSLVYAWCKQGIRAHSRFGRKGKRGTIRIDEQVFELFIRGLKVSEMPKCVGPLKHIK